MDKISREIIRIRNERPVIYKFTTYPIIFEAINEPYHYYRLLTHLKDMFINGMPPEKDLSPSMMPELILKFEEVKNSEYCKLASDSNYKGQGNYQHRVVQEHFLMYDQNTIATEVPVIGEKMQGNIDILIYDGIIKILDFKPEVHKCVKQAMTQLHYYKDLLCDSIRGIENEQNIKSKIECYAFDNKHCYKLIS